MTAAIRYSNAPRSTPGLMLGLTLCLFAGAATGQERTARFGAPPETATSQLLVRGSTDLDAFAPLLQRFVETSPGAAVDYEEWGTNDLYALAKQQCEGQLGAPLSDLIVSSAIDQQIKLVNDGCALPHRSDATSALPDWAKWRDEVFGVTLEPAVMVYNRMALSEDDVPKSRFDLIDLLHQQPDRFRGRIATYDIEASGLGYLFAFMDAQQAATFGRLIEAFGRAQMITKPNSASLIDAVAEGRVLVAYNLLGSYALARARTDPRIGVAAPRDYTLVLSRAALIPRHAPNPDAARRLIDFTLSPIGREELSESGLVVRIEEQGAGDSDREQNGPLRIEAAASSIRPIAFSLSLLVGQDRSKKRLFLAQWRKALAN